MTDALREQKITQALNYLQQGQMPQCAEICRELTTLEPRDAEAWSFLGMATISSSPDAGHEALQRATTIEPSEPRWHLHLGIGLLQTGKFVDAEPALATAAKLSGGAVQALIPWGDCLASLERYHEAASVFDQAAKLNADPAILKRLSSALFNAKDYVAGTDVLERAYVGRSMPDDDKHVLADLHIRLGNHERAEKYLDDLSGKIQSHPEIAITTAQFSRWRGEMDKAVSVLRDSMAVNKNHAGLLVAMLEQKLPADEKEKLIAQAEIAFQDESVPTDDRRALAFACAKSEDKNANFDKAWHFACAANALYADGISLSLSDSKRELANALSLYGEDAAPASPDDPKLIYVIGPPRSGGTLLQTVLAADPDLASVGEWGALLQWIFPLIEADVANTDLWNAQKAELQRADIAGLRSKDRHAKIFVDKTPHQAHVAGLLARIHPGAKFVNSVRDYRDVAVSIFFHDFMSSFSYSRSIKDIAAYLGHHKATIHTWRAHGLEIFDHDHEAFVRHPQQGGKEIFSALGLTWNSDYLAPEKRDSFVRTFSAMQVREKVSSAFSERWKNYEPFMPDEMKVLAELNG